MATTSRESRLFLSCVSNLGSDTGFRRLQRAADSSGGRVRLGISPLWNHANREPARASPHDVDADMARAARYVSVSSGPRRRDPRLAREDHISSKACLIFFLEDIWRAPERSPSSHRSDAAFADICDAALLISGKPKSQSTQRCSRQASSMRPSGLEASLLQEFLRA
ncbi:hypothetical protein ACCO45_004327 [Purpureocillium lilacinum]|uniref:Uncharacterized protein n=1 Tax=Purpureocillium lilacinum TaxID=33203 RepID=A0ACC4E4X9_PURLI